MPASPHTPDPDRYDRHAVPDPKDKPQRRPQAEDQDDPRARTSGPTVARRQGKLARRDKSK